MDRPAILFQISNHENFFHYLNDGFMGVLETLTETKLLPDRLARCVCRFTSRWSKHVCHCTFRCVNLRSSRLWVLIYRQAASPVMKCIMSRRHCHCATGRA